MCIGIGGYTLRGGKVLMDDYTDFHAEIASRHRIRDYGLDEACPWEFVPPVGGVLTDWDSWQLRIEPLAAPSWWDDSHAESARREALAKIARLWQARRKTYIGSLNISCTGIKSLGSLQSVGGDLDLNDTGITSLGSLQSVGGDLLLARTRITSLGSLQNVGGDLDLAGRGITNLIKCTVAGQTYGL